MLGVRHEKEVREQDVKLATLSYQDCSPWQDLTRSERQRFLDRGKLTARDRLTILEKIGLDVPSEEKKQV